ncbi:MAG: DinB family protein [Cyclobacteriaceae bacterium]|nr:DinB family protein [Cyclobacteriaceae bacterium]
MKKTINELQEIVIAYSERFTRISESDFVNRPAPEKWSKKEVVGHLIDSAQSNLRRFVVAQYEANPKITYDQNFWVTSNDYQHQPSTDVIQLWKLLNLQICAVLKSMSVENYTRTADTGKQSVQLHTLEWLAEDYVKHLKHHINQIIPASFNITYP